MTVDRSVLQHTWVHSHEEDTAGETVFRPEDYPFPPSRGRMGFELRSDGSYVESAIGPADRPEAVTGSWELIDDTLVVSRIGQDEPERRMRIVSASPDRLVLASS